MDPAALRAFAQNPYHAAPMRLFIIRHADPDYPNNTITPAGHLEAGALARRMSRLGLDRIYCSPLGRAIDTARYTADTLNIEPIILPWTAELDWRASAPPWGELMAWDSPGEIIRAQSPRLAHETWHELSHWKAGELHRKFTSLQRHSDEFLAGLGYVRQEGLYRPEKPNREKIAIFCHGGFGLTWIAHLLDIPVSMVWAGFWLPPSSVTTILFDERSADWATPRCIGMGDVSHLYEANLPVQPSGIKANAE